MTQPPPDRAAPPGSPGRADQGSDGSSSSVLQRHLCKGVLQIWVATGRDTTHGTISAAELAEGLERMQLPCSKDIVRDIFLHADENEDGVLDYGELLGYVRRREEEIAGSFSRLTRKQSHACAAANDISFSDLKEALHSLGVRATNRQIASFIARLDKEDTGTVSLEEFSSFVCAPPPLARAPDPPSPSPAECCRGLDARLAAAGSLPTRPYPGAHADLLPRVDVAAAFESWTAAHVGGLDTGAEPGQSGAELLGEPAVAVRASSCAVFLAGSGSRAHPPTPSAAAPVRTRSPP